MERKGAEKIGRDGFLVIVFVATSLVMGLLTYGDGEPFRLNCLMACLWVLPIWITGGALLWYRYRPKYRYHLVYIALLMLLVYLFLRVASAPDFFYMNWLPTESGRLGDSWAERVLFLGGIALIVSAFGRRSLTWLMFAVLLILQVGAFLALLHATGGEPLYRVDHPSFFLRLWSYAQMMPRFIFYDPLWNGGVVMPYLVASGVTAPGLFLWPVWHYVPTEYAYTPAFGILFTVIVPLLAVFAISLISRNRLAWIAAALMSLGTSHFYFVHLVHYGTFGSLFAASFLMPASACLYRLIALRKSDLLTWCALLVSAFFLLCWPGIIGMVPPFVAVIIYNYRRFTVQTIIGLVICIVLLTLLHLPAALSLISHSNLKGFVQTTQSLAQSEAWHNGWVLMARLLRQSHPVILFLGGMALMAVPARRLRSWFLPLLLVSLPLASWGKEWKEILQFDRIWINALFMGIVPAAWIFGWLSRRRDWVAYFSVAFLCGQLAMGGYMAVKYMGNKGRAKYRIMSAEMKDIVGWIGTNVPPDGRVLFAGAAGHGYGAGKVAALPVFTGREMMACDYYGFSPKLVEYNYPPREFRKSGPDKLMHFFDVYNVTHIVTFHDDWKSVFRRYSDQYREEISHRKKTIFRVLRNSNMFLEGNGKVSATLNSIIVEPDDPRGEVVIKYNWVDGLTADSPGVKIEPHDTGTSVKLIRIIANGAPRVVLSYDRWY